MKFEVIQHQQTPATPEIVNLNDFLLENKDVIEGFKAYACSLNNAIGLAANQCSVEGQRVNLRMVIVKDINTHECIVAINPKVTKYYGINRQKAEGCLTWGFNGVYSCIVANRYHFVDVEYYTPDGVLHQETHKGFQAQVWQHETNHINGIEEVVMNTDFDLEAPADLKTNRNDQCPCGSGKKYKKCCIDEDK